MQENEESNPQTRSRGPLDHSPGLAGAWVEPSFSILEGWGIIKQWRSLLDRAINTRQPIMDSADEKNPLPTTVPEPQQPAPSTVAPQNSGPTAAHSLRNEIRVWTRDLLIAIGLALVIIVFLYQPVKVEGTSMAPLLSDHERI